MSTDESDDMSDISASGGEAAPGRGDSGEDSAGLLDSLLRAFEERGHRASDRAAAKPGAVTREKARQVPAQGAPDQTRRPNKPADTGATTFTSSSTTASDIEALIKIAADSSVEANIEVDEPPGIERHMDEFTGGSAEDADADESLFEELSDAAEESDDERANVLNDVRALSSAPQADELRFRPAGEDEPMPSDSPAGVEASDSDDWLTDLNLEQSLAWQAEDFAEGDTDPETVLPVDRGDGAFAASDMEDPRTPDTNVGQRAKTLDDLFNEEQTWATTSSEDSPIEFATNRIQFADRESEGDSSVVEEIGSENGAAAAVRTHPAPGLQSEPAPAAPFSAGVSWLPPPPMEVMREHPRRAAAAIVVGFTVGLGVFVSLALNQYRGSEAILGDGTPVPLDRAIRLSASMVDQRDYASAARVLDDALAAASKSDPFYTEARFQWLSATVAALPTTLSSTETNRLHSEIDEVVLEGGQHPRTAEALMWKAIVYEREDNPAAARAEYRGILEVYENAPNRDEVLLRLGQLELKFDRPEDAILLARGLIADHPDSMFLNEARLLLGDASAAAGDEDGAREIYTRLAEELMDSAVGAQAFVRLGTMAIASGEAEAAIRGLESRLRTATTVEGNEHVYLVLARAYRASRRPEEARNILNELIDFFPESEVTPLALVELSQVLVDLGLDAQATRFGERMVDRYPDHPEVLVNSATLLGRAGQHANAGRTLLRAYDAGAKRPGVLIDAGREFALAESPRDAQSAYERAVLEFPSAPETVDAHVGWARAAIELGRVNDAFTRLAQISETTEGGPRQLPVLIALADLYGELGLQQDANATYTKIATVTYDPDVLAYASQRLIEAGAVDEGVAIARGIDVAALSPARAYPFLQAWGGAMLRADADEAVELLQRAHDAYPSERTAAGVSALMKAVLARGRTAQARTILVELKEKIGRETRPGERDLYVSAAADYGDYLFARQDFAAAAEAYGMAAATPSGEESAEAPTETEYWNSYQRANALLALGRVEESLALYELVSKSGTSLARDARARGDAARLNKRRVGGPPQTPAGAGR